jgi:hypothetical protein
MSTVTPTKRILWTAVALSVVVAAIALAAGIQHNAQGEFFDSTTGSFDIAYAALIFGSWFVPSFVIVAACGAAMIAVMRLAKHRRSSPDRTTR